MANVYVHADQLKPVADFLWKAMDSGSGVTIREHDDGVVTVATDESETTITTEGRET